MKIKLIKGQKGITGIDATIAIIIIVLFTGIIASMMYNSYKISTDIIDQANLDAYVTVIFEKIDEKPYEEIKEGFIENLISSGEIEFSSPDDINYSYEILDNYKDLGNKFKKVDLNFSYKEKSISISKLKVKEIGE